MKYYSKCEVIDRKIPIRCIHQTFVSNSKTYLGLCIGYAFGSLIFSHILI